MSMTLVWIVLATLAGGVLSVLVAVALTESVLSRVVRHMVSLSTGVLLGTALLNLLPEAFESGAPPQRLFLTLLAGVLFFFLLQKAELYRHSHHHEGDDPLHHHHHGFDAEQAGRGGVTVLLGDSVHNFCDGVLIAAAFAAGPRLGLLTALAVIAHEVPHKVGDYIVLLNARFSKRRAVAYSAIAGLAAVLGGVVGYVLLAPWRPVLPYLLVVASSSFVYVGMADLIPQLQRRLSTRDTVAQLAWLAAGLLAIAAVSHIAHEHGSVSDTHNTRASVRAASMP